MPIEYFERRERALLGDRFDALYTAPGDTAARGVTALKWDPFGKSYLSISGAALDQALRCVAAVREATPDQLENTPGVGPQLAQTIYRYFHTQE